jgi:hypothetical protein
MEEDNIYNNPECCNKPCKCPVCFDNIKLVMLNCKHYVCYQCIMGIINGDNKVCPICRKPITSYGCNDGYDTEEDYSGLPQYKDDYDTDVEYGGKRKINRSRKTAKKRKTIRSRKNTKRRKTKSRHFKSMKI